MKSLPINPEKWYCAQELVKLLNRTPDAVFLIVLKNNCKVKVVNDIMYVYGQDIIKAITPK